MFVTLILKIVLVVCPSAYNPHISALLLHFPMQTYTNTSHNFFHEYRWSTSCAPTYVLPSFPPSLLHQLKHLQIPSPTHHGSFFSISIHFPFRFPLNVPVNLSVRCKTTLPCIVELFVLSLFSTTTASITILFLVRSNLYLYFLRPMSYRRSVGNGMMLNKRWNHSKQPICLNPLRKYLPTLLVVWPIVCRPHKDVELPNAPRYNTQPLG